MKRDIFKIKKSSLGPRITRNNGSIYKIKVKDIDKLIDRAKRINKQLSEVKPLYSELEEITMALLTVRDHLERRGVAVVDNFENKNTQFKTVAISRYLLQWKAQS